MFKNFLGSFDAKAAKKMSDESNFPYRHCLDRAMRTIQRESANGNYRAFMAIDKSVFDQVSAHLVSKGFTVYKEEDDLMHVRWGDDRSF